MFKLSPLTFIVCGVVIMAVIWAGFWIFKIGPERQEIAWYKEHNEQLREIISPASIAAAVDRVANALDAVDQAQIQWKEIAERRTPAQGRFDLTEHRWQLTVNVRDWHGTVEQDLRRWISKSGVTFVEPLGGPFVPYPTDVPNELVEAYFNYPALPYPVAVWDMGTVTVEGTYDQIINNVRSWVDIPGYVATVRGLAIEGTGNRLRGSYNLLIVAYINTPNVASGMLPNGRVQDNSVAGGQGGDASGTVERPGSGAGGASGGGSFGGGGGGGGAAEQAQF